MRGINEWFWCSADLQLQQRSRAVNNSQVKDGGAADSWRWRERTVNQPMCLPSQLTVAAPGSYLSGFVELLLEPRYRHDGCSCALVPDRDDDLDAAGQRWKRDLGGPNWCVTMMMVMMMSSHTSLHVLVFSGGISCLRVCVRVRV